MSHLTVNSVINATAGSWTRGMKKMEVGMTQSTWRAGGERCLEELMLELRPEGCMDVPGKKRLRMVPVVNSTIFLDCSLPVFL